MRYQRPPIRRAFTLVEVLLATALIALIGVAVAMMLSGIARETLAHDTLRRQMMTRQVVVARLGALMRPAARVLEHSESRLVVWKGDHHPNGAPDLSELLVLMHDPDSKTLFVYEAPPGQDADIVPTYTFFDDFGAIAAAHAGTALLPGTPLIKDLESLVFRPDRPDIATARRICIDAIYDDGTGAEAITTVSSLRASPSTP